MQRSVCSRSSFGGSWLFRPDPAQPRGRRRGGARRRWQRTVLFRQIAAIGRAADVLQRLLKTQQALAADSPSELYQLLDEAAKYMDDPSLAPDPNEEIVIEEYVPRLTPYLTSTVPLRSGRTID